MPRDAHARVERGVRILEHWLHELRALEPAVGADRPAGERYGSGGGGFDAEDQPGERALAAAGLADEAQRLALAHDKVDAAQRLERAAGAKQRLADGVGLGGAPDRENVGGHHTPSARRVQAPASRPLPSSGSTQRTRRPSGAGRSGTAPAALRALA